MRLNKYFMLGLAGLAFAACSNEEEVSSLPQDGGEKMVQLTINRAVATSRAVDGIVNTGDVNFLKDAKVFFTAGGGEVVHSADISEDKITELNEASTHKVSVTFEKVPATAKRVYMVANFKENGIDLGNPSTKADLDKVVVNLAGQNVLRTGANNTAVYTTLKGAQETDFTSTTTDDGTTKKTVYSGSVTLTPIVCRLELNGIRSTTIKDDATELESDDVKSYTVEGVYINAFYTKGFLAANFNQSDRIDNGDDNTKYNKDAEPYKTYTYAVDALNEAAVAVGDNNTSFAVTPAEGKTWARQLFPGEVPHIVVKLTNVTYESGTTEEQPKYLTIEGYRTAEDGALLEVEAGKVYKINEIVFDANDLTDRPYQEEKTIAVDITVAAWKAETITPEL